MVARDVEEFDSGYGESSRYAAHLDRGWALLDRGDMVAARTSVEHAQEVRPEDPDAKVLLGAIALAEGDPNEALRCYERALELDTDYLEPYIAAAQVCLFDLNDPVRALHFCNEALELDRLDSFEVVDLLLLQAECKLARDETIEGDLGSADDFAVVVKSLELAARGPTEADLEGEDDAVAHAADYLLYDQDGDPLDEEEQRARTARAFQLVMRWSRLRLDAEEIEPASEQLQALTQWFPEEADAWYLAGEAYLRGHDVLRATEASLRTLELDARFDLPAWLPSSNTLQSRVLAALRKVNIPRLEEMIAQERPVAVLIQERPGPELVAEGVDPRIPALALGCRARPEDTSLSLSGVAVYIANIARLCRDETQFEDELRLSLSEELQAFFTSASLPIPDDVHAPSHADDGKNRRKRRRSRKNK